MTTMEQARIRKLLNRRNVVIAGVLAVIVAAVGVIWFQPQKLFIDETVNEAALGASETTDGLASSAGTFSSLSKETNGQAIVTELADGSRVLRLEDFETSNGPDVRVYLSAGEEDSYGKDFVDLGGLKGNVGNQNYAIPSGTDLKRYDTAVIWCRRFTVAFGAAELG